MHALIERRYLLLKFSPFLFFIFSNRFVFLFKEIVFLCVAIGALKDEARKGLSLMASNGKFDDVERAKPETDKKSWMSSAQLWISNPNSQFRSVRSKSNPFYVLWRIICCVIDLVDLMIMFWQTNEEEEDRCVSQNPFQTCNYPNQGGVFMPFNRPPPPPPPAPLSLMTPTSEMMMDYSRIEQSHHHHQFNKPSSQSHHIQKKEQRRRWSQELHRKFVDALHRLGGPQG